MYQELIRFPKSTWLRTQWTSWKRNWIKPQACIHTLTRQVKTPLCSAFCRTFKWWYESLNNLFWYVFKRNYISISLRHIPVENFWDQNSGVDVYILMFTITLITPKNNQSNILNPIVTVQRNVIALTTCVKRRIRLVPIFCLHLCLNGYYLLFKIDTDVCWILKLRYQFYNGTCNHWFVINSWNLHREIICGT